jgi:hypothetical protein
LLSDNGMRTLALVSLVLAATGCFQLGDSSTAPPPPPQVAFLYSDCPGGLFDNCDTTAAFLGAGAHALVDLVPGDFAYDHVESSAPDVMTVEAVSHSQLRVTGLASGSATIRLVDAAGHVVGHAGVGVVAPRTLVAHHGWPGDLPRVLTGVQATLTFDGYPQNSDAHTRGGGGVQLTAFAPLAGAGRNPDYDEAWFVGQEPGLGIIMANAFAAEAHQVVEVVDPAEVIGLDVTTVTSGRHDIQVTVAARTATGPVYGLCDWTLSDPAIQLFHTRMRSLDRAPAEVTGFKLPDDGMSYAATCTLAGHSAAVRLR